MDITNIPNHSSHEEESSWSHTRKGDIFNFHHKWTIEDISLFCQGSTITTSNLSKTIPGTNNEIKWRLELDQLNFSYDKYAAVFIRLISYPIRIDLKFKFSILNKQHEEVNEMSKTESFLTLREDICGFETFLKMDDLLDERKGYIHEDKLTILFEGKGGINGGKVLNSSGFLDAPLFHNENTLIDDLFKMFKNQTLCDVTLTVSDNQIRAHKNILAAQSPVFRAMFEHDTKERRENIVVITDMDYDVLQEMLCFMYSGKVQHLGTMAADLLAAANKYGLNRLRVLCVETLYGHINVENAAEVLRLARLYNANELHSKALSFIKKNATKVINTDGWSSLLKTQDHDLITEIFRALVQQYPNI